MSLANSKKTTPAHTYEWAGVVARVRRGAAISRAGRRSALLSVLTSVYANSTRPGESRKGSTSSDRS